MTPEASIIICTFNRSRLLADTMDTLIRSLSSFPKPVEVIVVNNASTDDTERLVRSLIQKTEKPHIRLLHESRQGLSYARNAGLEHARGDIICFLDDDVFVPEGWLQGLLAPFALSEEVGGVTGRVRLHFESETKPGWFTDRYRGVLSESNRGDSPCLLTRSDDMMGGNCALKRKAVSAIGLYNTELGRKGYNLLSGEDTDYAQRLWEKGFKLAYAPDGYINHRIPSNG